MVLHKRFGTDIKRKVSSSVLQHFEKTHKILVHHGVLMQGGTANITEHLLQCAEGGVSQYLQPKDVLLQNLLVLTQNLL